MPRVSPKQEAYTLQIQPCGCILQRLQQKHFSTKGETYLAFLLKGMCKLYETFYGKRLNGSEIETPSTLTEAW